MKPTMLGQLAGCSIQAGMKPYASNVEGVMTVRIGVLGVGHIGKTLAVRLGVAGHAVKVANSRGPKTIADEVLVSGAHAVSAVEAVSDVDVLIFYRAYTCDDTPGQRGFVTDRVSTQQNRSLVGSARTAGQSCISASPRAKEALSMAWPCSTTPYVRSRKRLSLREAMTC
jgi:F420-dependent NADP oxidoreductase-like protein